MKSLKMKNGAESTITGVVSKPNTFNNSKIYFMPTTQTEVSNQHFKIHHGPSPGIVAIIYTLLFIAGIATTIVMTHGAAFPIPYGPLDVSQKYYLQFPDAVRVNSFLLFGSAIPLGIYTAAVTSRLKFLGVNVSGVSIALFGGIAASVFLAISGLSAWVLSQPGIADSISAMHAFQLFGFAAGGVGHVVTFGLLMAGVSVVSLFGGYTPKWLAWFGLILAAISELSALSLIFPMLSILLPVRFLAFIWMIIAGFTIPGRKIN
jgi:hypothetical protein